MGTQTVHFKIICLSIILSLYQTTEKVLTADPNQFLLTEINGQALFRT
jgi:hypothetical protein